MVNSAILDVREPATLASRAAGQDVWSRTVHRGSAGALVVGGVDVRQLARRFGTPAFVLDEAEFRGRCQEFRAAGPHGRIYYGGKAFLCRAVAAIAHEEGLGIDVCSVGELAVALGAGVPAASIAFHGNNKSVAELQRAVTADVGLIVLDSGEEIGRLTAIARRLRVRPRVMIRVTPGVEAHTHDFIATAHDDVKFGFSLRDGSAEAAILRVQTEGVLDLRGLHCHVGSQIFDASAYKLAASRLLALYARLCPSDGQWWPELNLGGGFGVSYTTSDEPAPFADVLAEITGVVTRECAALRIPVPTLLFEPGRAIAGPSMLTLYRVGTIKALPGLRTYVSVDGGMSENIRTALYGATYTAVLASRDSTAPTMLSRVVGKHCESGDIVVRDARLPSDLRVGDLLAVATTGAYCRSMASNYNHVPRPPVISVRDGQARVIVRRETERDLMAVDVWP